MLIPARASSRGQQHVRDLQQAIISSRLTAPKSVCNTPRNSRTTQSMTVITWKRYWGDRRRGAPLLDARR
jgi:hypothetical protein